MHPSIPNRDDSDVLLEDHVHNYKLIHSVFPDYAQSLPDVRTWQGRASVRAQSLDYFPVLGKMSEQTEIYSFAGLGSKGFLFAPLCSEILAAQILKEPAPFLSHCYKSSVQPDSKKSSKPKSLILKRSLSSAYDSSTAYSAINREMSNF